MALSSSSQYAGDISATEAWERLQANPKAQLVDVRTVAEWNFVGLPDLASLGRRVHCVEWQNFPSMAANPDFVRETAKRAFYTQQTSILCCVTKSSLGGFAYLVPIRLMNDTDQSCGRNG